MKTNFTQCKAILDTLPIGFYFGNKLEVTLDPASEATFVNMLDRHIYISYRMIEHALESVTGDISEHDVEEIIRGFLYHEVSHCILTHQLFKKDHSEKNCAILNIFEDERIETILKSYYLDVNFKRLVVLMNGDGKAERYSKDPVSRYYVAVRLHQADDHILDIIQNIIRKYKDLHNEDGETSFWCKPDDWEDYENEIIVFYRKYFEDADPEENPDAASDSTNDEAQTDNDQKGKSKSRSSARDDKESKSEKDASSDKDEDQCGEPQNEQASQTGSGKPIEPESFDIGEFDVKKLVKTAFRDTFEKIDYSETKHKIERILVSALNKHGMQAAAQNGYAGQINPRLCGNRDYRWFVKRQDAGSDKRYSKVKINLFVDTSGSFHRSQNAINALIQSLVDLEHEYKDFEIDLVEMNWNNRVAPKTMRSVKCDGGNCLDHTIDACYNAVQAKDARNYNIVVFDGDCQSDVPRSDRAACKDVFKIWNHPNCVIISDTDNQSLIEGNTAQAKVKIIRRNYAETFINEAIALLERALV